MSENDLNSLMNRDTASPSRLPGESNIHLRTLFNAMSQGVIYQDAEGKIIAANPAAEEILGVSFEEMRGRTTDDPRWHAIRRDGSEFPGEQHPAMVALTTGIAVQNVTIGLFNPRENQYHWMLMSAAPEFRPGEDMPFEVFVTFTDITRLKQVEDELRESRANFLTAFHFTPTAQVISEVDTGMILEANDAYAKMVGYKRQELLGKTTLELGLWQNSADRKRITHEIKRKGYVREVEIKFLTKNKQERILITSIELIDFQDKQCMISSALDITDRKQANEILRKSEEKFRSTFDHMLEGAQILDFNWQYLYINRAAEIHNRRAKKEMLGKKYAEMWPGIEDTEIYQVLNRCMANRIPLSTEYYFTYPDGNSAWFQFKIQPVPEGILILSEDITGIKHTELNYKTLVEQSPVVVYESTSCGKWRYISPQIEKILGYPAPLYLDYPNLWVDSIYIEDHKKLQENKEENTLPGHHSLEYRMKTKKGDLIWIRDDYDVTQPGGEESFYKRGVFYDITSQKNVENNLRVQERMFKLFVEYSPAAIAMLDMNMKYIAASRRFLIDYGLGDRDVIGLSHYEIFPEISERWKEIHRRCLAGAVESAEDDPFPRADGKMDWVKWEIHPWYEAPDKIGGILLFSEVVTKRKEAEIERTRLSERLNLATRSAHIGIWDWDLLKGYVVWDENTYALLGLKSSDTPNVYQTWLSCIHPEDRDRSNEAVQKALAGESDYDIEARVIWPDQSIHWFRSIGEVYRDSTGQPVRMLGLNYEITGQKNAEEALQKSQEQYRELFDNNPHPMWVYDLETLAFLTVNDAAEKHYGYSRDEFMHMTLLDIRPEEDYQRLFENVSAVTEGVDEAGVWKHKTKDGTLIDVEITSHTLDFNGRKSELVLANDVTERVHAENAAIKIEERYHNTLDNMLEGCQIIDHNWRYVYLNDAAVRQSRLKREDLIGHTMMEAFPGIDHQEMFKGLRECMENRTAQMMENRFIYPDGTYGWFELSVQPSPEGIFILGVDISARKKAEEEIRSLLQKNQDALISSRSAYWEFDLASNKFTFNDRFFTLHGISDANGYEMSAEEFTGKYVHPDYIARVKSIILEAQRGKDNTQQMEVEGILIRSNGEEFWVKTTVWSEKDLNGNTIKLRGVSRDITESKMIEIQTRQKELELAETRQLARIGSWWFDASANTVIWSDEVYRLFEIERNRFEGNFSTFLSLLHPDDRERVARNNQIAMQNEAPFDLDYRIISKSGEIKHFHEKGYPSFNNQGQITGLFGTVQDVTQQKETEIEVEEGEEKFRGLMDSLDTLVATLDQDGRLLFINDVAAASLGGKPADFTGKTIFDLMSKTNADEGIRNIRRVIQENSALVIEDIFSILGQSRWFHVKMEPIHGEDGRVAYILINAADIHNHKTAQEQLLLLNKTLEQRVKDQTAEVMDLYENAPTGYHSLDAGGKFLMINNTELNWLGYTREEMIGRKFTDFITEQSRSTFQSNFPTFKKRGWVKDLEFTMIRKDGATFPVLLNATAIYDESGKYVSSRSTLFDISERDKAEKALRASESRLNFLLSMTPAIIFTAKIEAGFPVTFISESVNQILGYKPEQFLDVPEFWLSLIHEEEREDLNIAQRMFMNTGSVVWECRTRFADGQYRWMSIGISSISDCENRPTELIGYAVNIDEQKKAQLALLESKEQNRLLFEESPDGITLRDKRGVIIRSNRSYSKIAKLPIEQIIGKTPGQLGLLSEKEEKKILYAMEQAVNSQEKISTVQYRVNDAEGNNHLIESNIFAVGVANQDYFLVASRDITLQKNAEESLKAANTELERALRLKDEFLANMSHELRTPLNAILGISESLEEQFIGPLNSKQQQYIHTIKESGEHLLNLINDILDLSKIEAGHLTLNIQSTPVQNVVTSSIRMVKELAQKKGQRLTYTIDENVDSLDLDERRMKQVLVNLLSNAVKFTPEEGSLGVQVKGDRENGEVFITVWDAGIGIKKDDMPRLFQSFVQLDSGLDRQQSGTGLGLVLVSQIVRLHGGRVEVQSEPGQGSNFSVVLPWAGNPSSVGRPALIADGKKENSATIKNGHPKRILIVEDTESVILFVRDYLESRGYQVRIAQDGRTGIDAARAWLPDLILMDVQMPEMDGFEAAQFLKADAEIAHIPIIALTAMAMQGDRERCIQAGMDEYITKPISLRILSEAIQKFLK